MKDLKTRIGNLVRKLRKEKGLTQEELAERANLHPKYIGTIERGEIDIRIKNLLKITDALEIGLSEFFKGLPSKFDTEKIPMISEWLALIEDADTKTVEKLIAVNKEMLRQLKQ